MPMTLHSNIREVDPARLAMGTYDHATEEYIGEGDIYRSYSADAIALEKPVRKPFHFEQELWVNVRMSGSMRKLTVYAYRLVPERLFPRSITTYAEKIQHDGGASARKDPNGFYDGMKVKHGGEIYVLCGPEMVFVASEAKAQPREQLGLFG